jgi:hypothetical protein
MAGRRESQLPSVSHTTPGASAFAKADHEAFSHVAILVYRRWRPRVPNCP